VLARTKITLFALLALLAVLAWSCSSSSTTERPAVPANPEPVAAPVVIDAAPAPVVDAVTATAPDAPAAPARAARIEIAFVGDLMFGGYFDDHYDPQFVEKHDPLVEVAHLLKADLAFGNLETTITRKLPNNAGPHDGKGNKRFVTIPERVAVLTRDRRFHAVTLANNHQLDNDVLGLTETPKILDELGLGYVGAARTSGDKFRVETIDVKGWKVGFVAVTTQTNRTPFKDGPHIAYVPAPAMRNAIAPIVEGARANHDLVIVQIHWGAEYQDAPLRYQTDAAHAFIDAGADAVIGHHPHVLQGIERYKGGVIAYSLGNFVFPNAKERVRESGVLHLSFTHGSRACLDAIGFDPTVQIRQPITHPIPAKGAHRASIAKRLSTLSTAFATKWDVTGDRFTAPAACTK
jgi:poly-gamma-glutamate capsule biosynthesis protein CapA/YwtB (metallophosphatase superfamily)